MTSPTSHAAAEAEADALARDLYCAELTTEEIVARLAATTRPYYAWAATWSVLTGIVEHCPDDFGARRALEILRVVEPAVSVLG